MPDTDDQSPPYSKLQQELERIKAEEAAGKLGFTGFADSGSHKTTTTKTTLYGEAYLRLVNALGSSEAAEQLVEAYTQIIATATSDQAAYDSEGYKRIVELIGSDRAADLSRGLWVIHHPG